MLLIPPDQYNQALLANTHPPTWRNPQAADRYNLVVVGAGTAGLVAAAGAAGLGARVALVERHLMGGDCLNYGCVPSKALIRSARAAAEVARAAEFGVEAAAGSRVDFGRVMERLRRLRAQISPHDSARRFQGLGVDVFFGDARFTGPETIDVAGAALRFRKAVIATGTRAAAPPIPGLAEVGYLTNETVFSLTELPRRLAVIGAGPIGCELAQAFARLGAAVTLLEAMRQILPREDPDAAERIARALSGDGVVIHCGSTITAARAEAGEKVLMLDGDGGGRELRVDEVLVGVGRAPNVEGLGLDAAGVESTPSGVKVNDRLQTTNPRVYAAGDVCSPYKFTHAADAMARIVIQNALFLGRARTSGLTIPWCTYTDPEIAHVGLSEQEAQAKGIPVQSLVQRLDEVDRAVLDGATDGFVKLHLRRGTDQVLGATVVAQHAGEMIAEITLAMVGRLGLKTVAATIHPYPTQAEAIKKTADAYNRTRLTPLVRALLGRWLAWTR